MVNRHHHATAPLSVGGRLFIPGNERMFAVDLYNGTPHWEIELPRSRRLRADLTGNILVAGSDTLYMAVDDKCLRIDMATGKQKDPFPVPQLIDGKTYEWGYMALVDDVLVGTGQKTTAAFRKFTGSGIAKATWSPPESAVYPHSYVSPSTS